MERHIMDWFWGSASGDNGMEDDMEEYEIVEASYTSNHGLRQAVKLGEPTWTDGAGREIPLRQMDASHILNCIQLLDERRSRLANTMTRYSEDDNPVASRQLELWDDSIKAFFIELRRRKAKE